MLDIILSSPLFWSESTQTQKGYHYILKTKLEITVWPCIQTLWVLNTLS